MWLNSLLLTSLVIPEAWLALDLEVWCLSASWVKKDVGLILAEEKMPVSTLIRSRWWDPETD